MPKQVLIIEDEETTLQLLVWSLEESFSVMTASDVFPATTDRIMNALPQIDAIIFDGRVTGGTTIDLIAQIKAAGFSGFMIAASDDCDLRQKQIAAGCTHTVRGLKNEASKIVYNLLG